MQFRKLPFWRKYPPALLVTFGVIILILVLLFVIRIFTGTDSASGQLTIHVPTKGTSVYIDNEEYTVTNRDTQEVTIKHLSSGRHLVVTDKENHWPWAKVVTTEEDLETSIYPFNVAELTDIEPFKIVYTLTASGTVVTPKIAESLDFETILPRVTAPDAEFVLEKTDTNLLMQIEEPQTSIYAPIFCSGDSCRSQLEVLPFPANISSYAFYPGSSRHVILAANDIVSIAEIDRRDNQNIQLLYRSPDGSPVTFDLIDNTIYIRYKEGIVSTDLLPL